MRILLFDANVLIDLYDADSSIFRVVSDSVGPVHVVLPVFEEVGQIDEAEAEALGLTLVEPDLAHFAAAAELSRRLSEEDRICLVVAREEGWTCVTNDRALRRECDAARVEVIWGLELLALTVEAGACRRPAAAALARAIAENNPTHITAAVLERFLRRIGEG